MAKAPGEADHTGSAQPEGIFAKIDQPLPRHGDGALRGKLFGMVFAMESFGRYH
jgi:hypothetical protein